MAYCPKCGYKLKITDYKPECPSCGVNLMYYNMEERLAEDADKAEAEHIALQPRIDRVKSAAVGSPLSIVRLVCIFIPLGMLFLPLVQVSANIPYSPIGTTNVSILNLAMDVVANLNTDLLIKLFSSDIVGGAFICYALSIVGILLAAVVCLLNLFFVAFSNSPSKSEKAGAGQKQPETCSKGIKRNIIVSSLGIVFTLISIISFTVMNSKLTSLFGDIYSGKLMFGSFLVILGFAILIAINVIYKKKHITIKYTDLSEFIARIGNGSVAEPDEQEGAAAAETAEPVAAQ